MLSRIFSANSEDVTASGLATLSRIGRLYKRHCAARRWGISFRRASSFRIPPSIKVRGNRVPLRLPEDEDEGQRLIFFEVMLDDVYRLRYLAEQQKIQTIIDIGSNTGLFALAARAAFPTAKIQAYEPNRALEEYLKWQSRHANFTFFLEAVGLEDGVFSSHVDGLNLTPRRTNQNKSVPQIAFRQALERIGGHAGLVKLDCEGAEWKILQDCKAWQQVDFVTMEYHLRSADNHYTIIDALKEVGFEVLFQDKGINLGMILAKRSNLKTFC